MPFEAMVEDVYDELFAVKVEGAYFAAQELSPSELLDREIRVDAVGPGSIDTAILENEMSTTGAELAVDGGVTQP